MQLGQTGNLFQFRIVVVAWAANLGPANGGERAGNGVGNAKMKILGENHEDDEYSAGGHDIAF